MAILNRFTRNELGNTIEVLVALLDVWDGDPDSEPNGDDEAREADGDTLDAAYIEWQTMRGSQKRGPNILAGHEDDEEDDAPEEDDDAGQCSEDEISRGLHSYGRYRAGPGCPFADPGGCEHDGTEGEQMADDVPTFSVVSLEHNIFTDKRTHLGIGNLMSSFVAGGAGVLSADSGTVHRGRAPDRRSKPGSPV